MLRCARPCQSERPLTLWLNSVELDDDDGYDGPLEHGGAAADTQHDTFVGDVPVDDGLNESDVSPVRALEPQDVIWLITEAR